MRILFAWDFHGILEKGNEKRIREICNQVLDEFNIDRKVSIVETITWYGMTWSKYFSRFAPNVNSEEMRDMINRATEISKKYQEENVITSVLKSIKEKGHSNVVLSSMKPDLIRESLEFFNILPFIENFIEIPKNKDIDTIEYKGKVLRRYAEQGNFSKIVLIVSKETDVEVGINAGAKTYRYVSGNLKNPNEIIKIRSESKANRIINNLKDVLKELEN